MDTRSVQASHVACVRGLLTLNDQRSECSDTATRNADSRQHGKPKPSLGIHEGLQYVIPLPDAGCDTHLIHTQTLDRNQLLVIIQELCFDGGVRHEEPNEDRHDNCEQATKEEDDLV